MTFLDPSKFNFSLKMTMLSLLMTSLLAGCGIRGTLKTPPPAFGSASKVNPNRVPSSDLDKQDDAEDADDFEDGFEDGFEDDDYDDLDHDPLSDF